MEIVSELDIDGYRWEIKDSQARKDITYLRTDSDEKYKEINAKLEQKADKNAELSGLTIKNFKGIAQIIPWEDGTHYRTCDYKNTEDCTDVIIEKGNAKIVRVEDGALTKNEEIVTRNKIIDIVKPLRVEVPNSEYTNAMDLTSRVTIPDGYKFLCWTYVSTSGWITINPIYFTVIEEASGRPYRFQPELIPKENNESIIFSYLVIRQ